MILKAHITIQGEFMTRLFVSVPAFAAVLVFAVSAQAAHYNIDDSHSHVGFTIKHLVSHVKGEFKEFGGSFEFDPAKPEDTKGTFSAKTGSISTNNVKRDEHLKSPDFFDAKKFPEITLSNLKVSKKGDAQFEAQGDLTMHGVTKPVIFEVEFGGTAVDPWGGHRAGFTATTKVARKDFGIVWNKTLDAGGVMLGEDVMLDIQLEAVEGPAKAPESKNAKVNKKK
jgi:polyisoprenoid-binding protein YceI